MTIRLRVLGGAARAELAKTQAQLKGFQRQANNGLNVNGLRASGYAMTSAFTAPIVAASAAMFKYVLDNEKAMTNLKKVYGDNPAVTYTKDLAKLQVGFRSLSTVFGKNISEVNEIAAAWAAAGVSGGALTKSVENTLKTMTIGDLSATDATKGLIAIQAAYGANSEQLTEILQFLNTVENQTAVSTGDLVIGIQKAGGVAKNTGVTYQELAGHLAALVPIAGSASTAANGLKSIYSSLFNPTKAISDLLMQVGINTRDAGWESLGAGDRLNLLSDKFGALSTAQRGQLGVTIAGKFQVARLGTLLEDLANRNKSAADATSLYRRAMEHAADPAYNASVAQRELTTVLKSQPAVLARLKTSIKNDLMDVFIDLLPMLIGVVEVVKDVVHWFSQLNPSVQKAVGVFALVLAALGPVLLMFVAITSALKILGAPFRLLFGLFAKMGGSAKKTATEVTTSNQSIITSTAGMNNSILTSSTATQAKLTANQATQMGTRQAAFEANLAKMQMAQLEADATRINSVRNANGLLIESDALAGKTRNAEWVLADSRRLVEFESNIAKINAGQAIGNADLLSLQNKSAAAMHAAQLKTDGTRLAQFTENLAAINAREDIGGVKRIEINLATATELQAIWGKANAAMSAETAATMAKIEAQTKAGLTAVSGITLSNMNLAVERQAIALNEMVAKTKLSMTAIATATSTGTGTAALETRVNGTAMVTAWTGSLAAMEVRTAASMKAIAATTALGTAGAARSAGSVAAIGTPTGAAGRAGTSANQNRSVTNAVPPVPPGRVPGFGGAAKGAEKESGKIARILSKLGGVTGKILPRILGPFARILPFLGGILGRVGPLFARVFTKIPGILTGALKFIPRVLGGALRGLMGIPGLILIAVLTILDRFGGKIKEALKSIGNWIAGSNNIFARGIKATIDFIVGAFNMLPDGIKGALTAVVKMIAAVAMKVYDFLQYLNPFAHHSPSVVENVTNGMSVVMAQFNRLTGISAPVMKAYNDLQKFSTVLARVQDLNSKATQAANIKSLGAAGFGADAINAYKTMYADMSELEKEANAVNMVIQVQQQIVNTLSAAVDRLNAAYDKQNDILQSLQDKQQAWQDKIDATQSAIQKLQDMALPGERAMEDQIFANEQAQKRLQLAMMKIEDVTGPIDDVKSKMAELAAQQDTLAGNRNALRAGGAGSEITKPYDDQIKAIQKQQGVNTGLIKQYDDMQKALDALGRESQKLDLEKSLNFDGLHRAIEQAANAITEMPFDQIMKGITENNAALKTYQAEYDKATIAVGNQQKVVDALDASRKAAQATYDVENNKLNSMQAVYSQLNDAISAINDKLDSMTSAASAASEAMSKAGSDAASAFAAAADGGNIETGFGNALGGGGDIDDMNKQIDNEFKDLLGGGSGKMFDGLKKAWQGFLDFFKGIWNNLVRWFKGIGGDIADAFTSVIDFFKSIPGKIGDFFMAIPGKLWDALKYLVTEAPGKVAYASGYILGLLVKGIAGLGILIGKAFMAVWNFIFDVQMWAKIGRGILSGVGSFLGMIQGWMVSLGLKLLEWFGKAWSWLTSGDTWTGIGAKLIAGLAVAWSYITDPTKLLDLVTKLNAAVLSALSGAAEWLVDIGMDILRGLIKGVENGWDWAYEKVSGWIASFVQGFKDALGIKSPSKVFSEIGMWIIEGLANGIKSVWNKITSFFSGAVDWLKQKWNDFITGIKILWERYGQPIVDGIKQKWNDFKVGFGLIIDSIKNTFTGLWNHLSSIYTNIKTKVIDVFVSAVGGIKSAFDSAVTGIKTAWDKIQGIVKAPIKFVIDTVLRNALVPAFNFISSKVGGPTIDPNSLPHLASGGKIRGPGGPREDRVPAMLSNGEFVINAKSYNDNRALVEAINSGQVRAFADGGFVGPMMNYIRNKFPNANLNSGYRPGANDNHGKGHAVDLGMIGRPGGKGGVFLANMKQYIYDSVGKNTSELIYDGLNNNRPDLKHGNAHDYGPALRSQHQNHVHWAIDSLDALTGKGAGGGGGGILGAIIGGLGSAFDSIKDALGGLNPVKWITDKMNGALAGVGATGDLGKMVRAVPGKLLGSAVNKIRSLLGLGGNNEPAATGGAGGTLGAWEQEGLTKAGKPGTWLGPLNTLIQRESGGNPLAINLHDSNAAAGHPSKGLMQLIDSTFQGNRDKSLPNDVYNPISNIVAGLRYITGRYGTIFNVQQADANKPPKGYDSGGWLTPGSTMAVNKTGKPEAILTAGQWSILQATADSAIRTNRFLLDLESYLDASRRSGDENGTTVQHVTHNETNIVNLNGDIVLPNIKSGSDAADLVDNLKTLARKK